MKRIFSILLIFLIIFNAGGIFFIFNQLENHFKQVAFEKINDFIPLERLEKITVNKELDASGKPQEYERVNEKEILYNGNMYDIYYTEENANSITFYCLSDKYEDIIHTAFAKYINNNDNDKNYKAISNIIKILVTIGTEPSHYQQIILSDKNHFSLNNSFQFKEIKLDIPVPPPRYIAG